MFFARFACESRYVPLIFKTEAPPLNSSTLSPIITQYNKISTSPLHLVCYIICERPLKHKMHKTNHNIKSHSQKAKDDKSISKPLKNTAQYTTHYTHFYMCSIEWCSSSPPAQRPSGRDYWEKFHLVELNVLIKFHQNNQKVIYFWRFDLYQRPSSEEADTRSSSGSWRDKLESSQESGRTYDWVGSSLRPGSWIVDLPFGYELPPWSIW